VFTAYNPGSEDRSLPAIIPLKIQRVILWAYLDTGSGRNFISREAMKKLNLKPKRHESRQFVTINGVQMQSMPIFEVRLDSLDNSTSELVEITGSKMEDFTTVRRPTVRELKTKYEHARDKQFYMTATEEYPIHVILGDSTYCKIRTEQTLKGRPEDSIVEGTTFGWIIRGGEEYADNKCMYIKEASDYEKLYILDVSGVEDRGEDDQSDVYRSLRESITRGVDGRYEVSVPWIPGSSLPSTNEQPSRRRLFRVEKKLSQDPKLREEYEEIVRDQLEEGIVEVAPETPTGYRTFYMPHKPVVRESASTTKVRMVFDASTKPHPLANSVNECKYTGPPLQPLLWDILIRARMSTHLVLADIQKAFSQIGVREEDRDAFRFLFNINLKEQHLRFTRVPFGGESSPFLLGATLDYHYEQQNEESQETVQALRENTYVDNLMQTGEEVEELEKFKREATSILESSKFPVHKWESDVEYLESEDSTNPSKILGTVWDKRDDMLEIQVPQPPDDQPLTKRGILSHLASIYDPLGMISPTTARGKQIYRDTCEETKGWNTEVSDQLKRDWFKWSSQLKTVRVPRSVARGVGRVQAVHLHVFADASNIACSAVTIAVVEGETGVVKGLLTSKSRISKRNTSVARLELVGGQMAANMVRNLHNALKRWPIVATTLWMDIMVALYWIRNPGKPWKVFVANRVRKVAEITGETGIVWKYCPTERNSADLASRGAVIQRMVTGGWFTGPEWLLDKKQWPDQPDFKCTKDVNDEYKPIKEENLFANEHKPDEWETLLERNKYWKTLRVTAWALRFLNNALTRRRSRKKLTGPLTTEEMAGAKNVWIKKVQRNTSPKLQAPG